MPEHPISEMMKSAMDKIRDMVDANTVVGQPITTPDGVTLVPVSRVSFGFASGGDDKTSATSKGNVWGGSGAAVKLEPVGFLMIKDGTAHMVPIQPPAFSTADRVLDMLPDLLDKTEYYIDKYGKKKKNGV